MEQLIEALERAASGSDINTPAVKAIRFEMTNDELGKAALESWRRLVHFAADADSRSNDVDYDRQMRQEMAGRAFELRTLYANDAKI